MQTTVGVPAERSGFLPDRTVHLHPLARCNLACKHCYSSSSPTANDILSMDQLRPALSKLRGEGYEVLSLSGGEPMLYPDLADLIDYARNLGFRTVAITNGFRVNQRFASLVDRFDGLAVSFDGLAEVHNQVRLNPRAFDIAVAALRYLVDVGKLSAAAFTVSRESLAQVPDFVEMVAEIGVNAVQLRPLVMAGRAPRDYADPALSVADLNRLWLMGQALAAGYAGQMFIHTDLAHSQLIAQQQCAWRQILDGSATRLSDAVNPLVITPQGQLRPFTYDFPEAYDFGTIDDLIGPAGSDWRLPVGRLGNLVRDVFHEAANRNEFIDWFAFCRDVGRGLTT